MNTATHEAAREAWRRFEVAHGTATRWLGIYHASSATGALLDDRAHALAMRAEAEAEAAKAFKDWQGLVLRAFNPGPLVSGLAYSSE